MLIGLGVNVLYKLARGGRIHFHEHSHAGHATSIRTFTTTSRSRLTPITAETRVRPLIIGMVHGLAGSAALMLSVLVTIKGSTALAFAYIIIFGAGSIGGMMVMSLILSLPIHLTSDISRRRTWPCARWPGASASGSDCLWHMRSGLWTAC